jgi:hypothetical protein
VAADADSESRGPEPLAQRRLEAVTPGSQSLGRTRVFAIEQIAEGRADELIQFDAAGWISSAETATAFLVTQGEATRRVFGVAVLNLAVWCRALDVAPLQLSVAQIKSYLRQLEGSCVQSAPTPAQQLEGVLGYLKYAHNAEMIDHTMLEAVISFLPKPTTDLPGPPANSGSVSPVG